MYARPVAAWQAAQWHAHCFIVTGCSMPRAVLRQPHHEAWCHPQCMQSCTTRDQHTHIHEVSTCAAPAREAHRDGTRACCMADARTKDYRSCATIHQSGTQPTALTGRRCISIIPCTQKNIQSNSSTWPLQQACPDGTPRHCTERQPTQLLRAVWQQSLLVRCRLHQP
jgi:hypothetical protein